MTDQRLTTNKRTSPKGHPICTRTVKLSGDCVWNSREQRWEVVQETACMRLVSTIKVLT